MIARLRYRIESHRKRLLQRLVPPVSFAPAGVQRGMLQSGMLQKSWLKLRLLRQQLDRTVAAGSKR